MQIEDIVLRTKGVELLNSPVSQMAIQINNPDVKIVKQEEKSVIGIKDFNLKIIDKGNNLIIANFKLIFQIEISLNNDEVFSNSELTNLILPGIFLQINNMMGDLSLPRLKYNQFINILKNNS